MRYDPLAPFVRQITDMIDLIPVIDTRAKDDFVAKEWAFANDLKTSLPSAMGFNTAYRGMLYNNAENYDRFINSAYQPG